MSDPFQPIHAIVKKEENMPDPSQPNHALVKKEPTCICTDTAESPNVEPITSESVLPLENTKAHSGLESGITKTLDDKYWPLSGKPFFDVIFRQSKVNPPYQLYLPNKIVQELPSGSVPVVLTYCDKSWKMLYTGDNKLKRFDNPGWREFVTDNNLKVGDCCFFEITECSAKEVTFRTQILKIDFPSCLQGNGETPETSIIIE